MRSSTKRSMDWHRDRGWRVTVVERWLPFRHVRKDTFGGDILAIHPASKTTRLIQCTTVNHHYDHKAKVLKNVEVKEWVECGNEFIIQSWGKGCDPKMEQITRHSKFRIVRST